MPATPSSAQSETSRLNGALSAGPVTDAGKMRSALNAVRHGLSGRTFFLLPDEDPAEFAAHEAELLATFGPRDLAEREAVLALVRAEWREIRGDRLEAQVLGDLFAAARIEAQAARERVGQRGVGKDQLARGKRARMIGCDAGARAEEGNLEAERIGAAGDVERAGRIPPFDASLGVRAEVARQHDRRQPGH